MNNQYILTVIIPLYNNDKYIKRCLQSISNQSIKNIKIIIVDDGSTDDSLHIIRWYVQRYDFIECYTSRRQGPGMARNIGITNCLTKYITFIDSDDWIDPDMFQLLYDATQKYQADIAECSWRCIYSDRIEEETDNTGEYIVGDNVFALHGEIQWKYFKPIACNKIYDKKIFENIRFPVGKLHEDEFTTHLAFYNARKLVYIDVSKYNYDRTREESITASFREKNLDVIDALQSRLDFFYEKGIVELQTEMENMYFCVLLDRLYKCYLYGIKTDRVRKIIYDTNEKYFLNMELPLNPNYKHCYRPRPDEFCLFHQ